MAVSKSSFMTPTLRKNGATAIAQQFCPRSIGGDDAIRALTLTTQSTRGIFLETTLISPGRNSILALWP